MFQVQLITMCWVVICGASGSPRALLPHALSESHTEVAMVHHRQAPQQLCFPPQCAGVAALSCGWSHFICCEQNLRQSWWIALQRGNGTAQLLRIDS